MVDMIREDTRSEMKRETAKDIYAQAMDRIRCRELGARLMSAEEAALFIKDGMTVGASGFTPSGYPKAVPMALAERARQGEELGITLWTGASVGPELDGELTETGVIRRRFPYQTEGNIRKALNGGQIHFSDRHLSHNAQNIRYGFYGPVDVALIEAVAITEDGYIVPSTSVGNSPTFLARAKQIIVEINVSQPMDLEGIHDIYEPLDPPHRQPIPITSPEQRIGMPFIPCDPEKIVAIVPCDITDKQRSLGAIDETSRLMAGNLLDFLDMEVMAGRLPENLLPLQSGVGSVANAVMAGLLEWPTDNLKVYTEVIQDSMFDLIDAGKLDFASGTALTPSPEGAARMYAKMAEYKEKLLLRPQEISNHPEVIRRLGLIAMNTAVEIDIYGHVNSTMAAGTRMLNGLGGSGDFARNAFLTIFLTPSTAKDGRISRIVPFCSHVDHTEHDVDIIVTEWGVADLRGLSPRERSRVIIGNCAHPDYRPMLLDYFSRAQMGGGHEPHLLCEALSWHVRLMEKGAMLI